MTSLVSVASVLQLAQSRLEAAGVPEARLDAALLLADVMGTTRAQLVLEGDKLMEENNINEYEAVITRRVAFEPVAYITGKKEFWSLDFCVTRDTLIPRPDSETLVEAALERVKDRAGNTRILDIGTGTGCLLIALLKELPQASGAGVDLSVRALEVARNNAVTHNVDGRAVFLQSNWCDAVNGTFDLILSNPPYIAEKDRDSLMEDVLAFEPHSALFAGADGLDAYRALAPQLASHLEPGGLCALEVGKGQAQAVAALLRDAGLAPEAPVNDLSGIARCVIARKPH